MKFPTLAPALAATTLGVAAFAPAAAAPVFWAENNHYYEWIGAAQSWDSALLLADAATHMGLDGYLATVTSAEENAFVASVVAAGAGSLRTAYLGGTDRDSEGVWKWVAGPEAGTVFWTSGGGVQPGLYANWHGGEPNNAGGEHALAAYYFGAPTWNDRCICSVDGYVIEYSGAISGAVPEPATWAMMIAGFGLVGGAARRAGRRARPVAWTA